LAERGGGVLAISVDPPANAKRVVETNKLPFPILCDESRDATDKFGVLHKRGGPQGQDIPLPAMFLVSRDGEVIWERVARRVQDRPAPSEIIRAIEEKYVR
jgi:peroxiredoxin